MLTLEIIVITLFFSLLVLFIFKFISKTFNKVDGNFTNNSFSKTTKIFNSGKSQNICIKGNSVTINGVEVSQSFGEIKSVVQNGKKVIVNGVDISNMFGDSLNITLNIDGNVENVKLDNGDVYINGNVTNNVENCNGNIKCGDVGGSVTNKNGDIKAVNISGAVSNKNGDIKTK